MKKILFLLLILLNLSNSAVFGQQYNGMTGFIHTPSAEMNNAGDVRAGAHYMGSEMMPDDLLYEGSKYDSFSYYVNVTPFSWVEAAYACTSMKGSEGKFNHKDRHFHVKVRPFKEKKWRPAIAIGADDFFADNLGDNDEGMNANHFTCYWGAVAKHFDLSGHELGVNIGYRYFHQQPNKKYQGLNAAVTYRPAFAKWSRAIVEYDGYSVNIGIDALLFRHAALQVSCDHFKSVSAGLALQLNLLGRKNASTTKQ